MSAIFAIILLLLAIFLILLVLVQRGRGGGLAGALGGMGGSSAFGAKAGDVFTRITIVTAAIWIAISIIAFFWAKNRGDAFSRADDSPLRSGPVEPNAGGAPAATSTLPPTATQALEAEGPTQAPSTETKSAPPAEAEKK